MINGMKFSKPRCYVLHPGQIKARQKWEWGEEWLESSPAEREYWEYWLAAAHSEPAVVCTSSQKGKPHPGVHQRQHKLPTKSDYHIQRWDSLILSAFWTPQFKKGGKVPECIQRTAKLVRGLESRAIKRKISNAFTRSSLCLLSLYTLMYIQTHIFNEL